LPYESDSRAGRSHVGVRRLYTTPRYISIQSWSTQSTQKGGKCACLLKKSWGQLEGAVRRERGGKNQGFAPDCSLPATRGVACRSLTPRGYAKVKFPPLTLLLLLPGVAVLPHTVLPYSELSLMTCIVCTHSRVAWSCAQEQVACLPTIYPASWRGR
jgi:hypothetical protein